MLPQAVAGMSATTSSYGDGQTCMVCGERTGSTTVEILGQVREVPVVCRCAVDRQNAIAAAQAEARRQETVRRRFDATWLPARFEEATLEKFIRRPGAERALDVVTNYAGIWPDPLRNGEGLIIMGDPGNGKSHLAAGIVHRVVAAGGAAIFAKVPRLMVRFEATYRQGAREAESDLLQALFDADLVVLDDVGAEKWTEKREERLFLIVDARVDARRPIIATTNCKNVGDLEDHVGARTADRLLGACLLVMNEATSYRREKAKDRMLGYRPKEVERYWDR